MQRHFVSCAKPLNTSHVPQIVINTVKTNPPFWEMLYLIWLKTKIIYLKKLKSPYGGFLV